MPVYGSTDTVELLSAGFPAFVWDAETIDPVGSPDESASLAVCMHRNPNMPNCFSVEIAFDGDPGAFKVDLEVADTNEDEFFVTKASFTEGLNTSFVGRIEAFNVVAKFARLRMVTLTNAVPATAKFF